jgi:hypothetical protein
LQAHEDDVEVMMIAKLGSISRDAFPHRLDGMTDGSAIAWFE